MSMQRVAISAAQVEIRPRSRAHHHITSNRAGLLWIAAVAVIMPYRVALLSPADCLQADNALQGACAWTCACRDSWHAMC